MHTKERHIILHASINTFTNILATDAGLNVLNNMIILFNWNQFIRFVDNPIHAGPDSFFLCSVSAILQVTVNHVQPLKCLVVGKNVFVSPFHLHYSIFKSRGPTINTYDVPRSSVFMYLEVLLCISRGHNRYLIALDLDGKLTTRSTSIAC